MLVVIHTPNSLSRTIIILHVIILLSSSRQEMYLYKLKDVTVIRSLNYANNFVNWATYSV